MYPRDTIYRLANSPKDYHDCRELFCDNHGAYPTKSLHFPTVVAVRGGVIIGFLATLPIKDRIMAGPLEVANGSNTFVALRLIEAYSNVMKTAGVSQYEFFVDATRMDQFSPEKMASYSEYGVKYNQTYMGNAFFVKEVV